MSDTPRPNAPTHRWYILSCTACGTSIEWKGRPEDPRPLHRCGKRAATLDREVEIRTPAKDSMLPAAPRMKGTPAKHPITL